MDTHQRFMAFFKARRLDWKKNTGKYARIIERETKSGLRLYSKEHGVPKRTFEKFGVTQNSASVYIIPTKEWGHLMETFEEENAEQIHGYYYAQSKVIFFPERLFNSGKFMHREFFRHELTHYLDDVFGLSESERRAFKMGAIENALNPASQYYYGTDSGKCPSKRLIAKRRKGKDKIITEFPSAKLVRVEIGNILTDVADFRNQIRGIELRMANDPSFSKQEGHEEISRLRKQMEYAVQTQKGLIDALAVRKRRLKLMQQQANLRQRKLVQFKPRVKV